MTLSVTDQGALKKAIDEPPEKKSDDREQMMWEYVIEKHGKKEFEAVYGIIQ